MQKNHITPYTIISISVHIVIVIVAIDERHDDCTIKYRERI